MIKKDHLIKQKVDDIFDKTLLFSEEKIVKMQQEIEGFFLKECAIFQDWFENEFSESLDESDKKAFVRNCYYELVNDFVMDQGCYFWRAEQDGIFNVKNCYHEFKNKHPKNLLHPDYFLTMQDAFRFLAFPVKKIKKELYE